MEDIFDLRDSSWVDDYGGEGLPPGFFRPIVPQLYISKK